MLRTYVCIVCPNGCDLRVEIENGEASSVAGNCCPRGNTWVRGKVSDPLRVLPVRSPAYGHRDRSPRIVSLVW